MSPYENKKEINVVYLGGSITQGAAASRKENNWVSLVGKKIDAMFPELKVNHYNVGIGGTDSGFGMVRMQRDVLAHRPDLLFIEFAVNDSYDLVNLRGGESILLTLKAAGLRPYICIVCTAYRDPAGTTAHEKYKRLGKRYGIPVIDLRDAMAEERAAGRDVSAYFNDGCHPNDAGHALYAEKIGAFLREVFASPVPVIDGEQIEINSRPMFCLFRPVLYADWLQIRGDWEERDGVLVSTEPGAVIGGAFEGATFGVVDYWDFKGGIFLLELDGVKTEINTYYDPDVYQPACHYLTVDLAPGHHTFKITVLGRKKEESGGTEIVISDIITDGMADGE